MEFTKVDISCNVWLFIASAFSKVCGERVRGERGGVAENDKEQNA